MWIWPTLIPTAVKGSMCRQCPFAYRSEMPSVYSGPVFKWRTFLVLCNSCTTLWKIIKWQTRIYIFFNCTPIIYCLYSLGNQSHLICLSPFVNTFVIKCNLVLNPTQSEQKEATPCRSLTTQTHTHTRCSTDDRRDR